MKKLILIAALFAIPFISGAQAYNIKITIPGFANQQIILGHYFSDKMLPDDTAKLDAKGVGYLQGKEKLPGGMYFLFLPNRRYFDLMIDKNQSFEVLNDTTDFVNNFKEKNSPENRVFYDYQKMMISKSKEAEKLRNDRTAANGDKTKETEIDNKLTQLQKDADAEMQNVLTQHADMFLAAFLKATREVEIPVGVPDSLKFNWYLNHYFDNMPISDDRFVRTPIYENKVNNYLKVLDQMPADSINKYVDVMLEQSGANKEKGKRNEELFRYMLITVHNHYASSQIMGQDAVFVHIAEDYYLPKAYWADADYIKKLKENIAKTKTNLIGEKAPPLTMQKLPKDSISINKLLIKVKDIRTQGFNSHIALIKQFSKDADLLKQVSAADLTESKEDRILKTAMEKENMTPVEQQIHDLAYKEYVKDFESFYNEVDKYIDGYPNLNDVKADNTVVWFWEPDCSHCQHETPLMEAFYTKFNQLDFASPDMNVQVYAVYLPRAIDDWGKFTHSLKEWMEFVKKNNMYPWLNVWDPYGETNYRTTYNVYSTPTVYLLDENKNIIAKRIGVDAIRRILFDKYVTEKKDKLQEKDLLVSIDKMITLFSSKEELEDLKTVIEARLDGSAKEKALKAIEKKMPKEEKTENK